eukprot:TRINITY_DN64460_c0_g1_i1.p1 TRINITY_DN64460_c0_g1~~TRINITY_DN64460_c0_g1_i1.p1  ORF type:complete len:187 (+),score=31.75 TRINITY_DN64460_c0_g1_i1:79-561(+)
MASARENDGPSCPVVFDAPKDFESIVRAASNAVAPLPEEQHIFDLDAANYKSAAKLFPELRSKVDAHLKDAKVQDRDRKFCSDATLLRYLIWQENNVAKALSSILYTLEWRKDYLYNSDTYGSIADHSWCQVCAKDPRSHCFQNVGSLGSLVASAIMSKP